MRRVHILKTRIGIETSNSYVAAKRGLKCRNEYNSAVKQMNVNGKGKHVSIINKANKVEENSEREEKLEFFLHCLLT